MASPKKPRRNLLSLTLYGLPELKLFPTSEDRLTALTEISDEAGNPKTGSFWLAIAIIVGAELMVLALAGWLLRQVVWSPLFEDSLRWLAVIASFALVLSWLHRRGTAGELRMKLLAVGVPVCIHCGYLLRGLPCDPGRCPECGEVFSGRVREILSGANPSEDDKAQA